MQYRQAVAGGFNPDGSEDWIIYEANGSLSYENRPVGQPRKVTTIPAGATTTKVKTILEDGKATDGEKLTAVPAAASLATGRSPRAQDVTALDAAIAAAAARSSPKAADVTKG